MSRVIPRAVWHGEVSLVGPLVVVAAGLVVAAAGHWPVGAGMAAGALLAYANSIMLVSRVRVAVSTGDYGATLVSMQIGLLATFMLAGVFTVLLLQISRAMTVTMAISFFLTQTLLLALYYRSRVLKGREILATVKEQATQ